ncbi:hypothetical protein K402DRAFT_395586 [Aulographum hederae CBS 113979]|uniref:Uncharacterized protein n=1 Tax=Aulographum hederae CBS 113979 TaxID=1176131 RepID=A0A6G1GV02_9PEZI|nr:hypothetical protein K402DRAFT_395586 [Aulographum hederae CBS 113979]
MTGKELQLVKMTGSTCKSELNGPQSPNPSSRHTSDTPVCRLLSLPAELRLLIWEELLICRTPEGFPWTFGKYESSWSAATKRISSGISSEILRVSKTIYAKTKDVMCKRNELCFRLWGLYSSHQLGSLSGSGRNLTKLMIWENMGAPCLQSGRGCRVLIQDLQDMKSLKLIRVRIIVDIRAKISFSAQGYLGRLHQRDGGNRCERFG